MRFLRDNGLTLALLAVFILSLAGMAISGYGVDTADRAEHGLAARGFAEFMMSGRFLSALFENWESEFLQMAAYVILTAYLFQRGSAESRDPDKPDRPRDRARSASWLYAHSLGLALAALFLFSFLFHWLASLADANQQALQHGGKIVSALHHLADPLLWFESFQNWQSEFLSTAVLVVLSIFLRFRGSPESKPVLAGHDETGA